MKTFLGALTLICGVGDQKIHAGTLLQYAFLPLNEESPQGLERAIAEVKQNAAEAIALLPESLRETSLSNTYKLNQIFQNLPSLVNGHDYKSASNALAFYLMAHAFGCFDANDAAQATADPDTPVIIGSLSQNAEFGEQLIAWTKDFIRQHKLYPALGEKFGARHFVPYVLLCSGKKKLKAIPTIPYRIPGVNFNYWGYNLKATYFFDLMTTMYKFKQCDHRFFWDGCLSEDIKLLLMSVDSCV
ncbi:MAG: hypothetical protein LBJ89_02165 [Holosporales bacterium]|nr:hypothetical protein [Holosporales bacterium]